MKFFMMALSATLAVGAVLATPASAKEWQTHTSKPGESCDIACAQSPTRQGLAGTVEASPTNSGPGRLCTCKQVARAVNPGIGVGVEGGGVGSSTLSGSASATAAPATGVLSLGADGATKVINAPAAADAIVVTGVRTDTRDKGSAVK